MAGDPDLEMPEPLVREDTGSSSSSGMMMTRRFADGHLDRSPPEHCEAVRLLELLHEELEAKEVKARDATVEGEPLLAPNSTWCRIM